MLTKQQLKDELENSVAITNGLVTLVKKLRSKIQNQRKALRGLQRQNNELKKNMAFAISYSKTTKIDPSQFACEGSNGTSEVEQWVRDVARWILLDPKDCRVGSVAPKNSGWWRNAKDSPAPTDNTPGMADGNGKSPDWKWRNVK